MEKIKIETAIEAVLIHGRTGQQIQVDTLPAGTAIEIEWQRSGDLWGNDEVTQTSLIADGYRYHTYDLPKASVAVEAAE